MMGKLVGVLIMWKYSDPWIRNIEQIFWYRKNREDLIYFLFQKDCVTIKVHTHILEVGV